MHNVYLFCAIFGSAFVVISFFASLLGLGGDAETDAGDAGGDFDGGDAGDSADAGDDGAAHHDGSSGFLRAFSIRSISAGVAFFGLGGLIARTSGASELIQIVSALVAGFVGLYCVYRLMRTLSAFNQNNTLRASEIAGSEGTVYLRIPAKRGGVGKATILQQERLVEYEALTDDGEDLVAGTPIVAVKQLSSDQILVAKA